MRTEGSRRFIERHGMQTRIVFTGWLCLGLMVGSVWAEDAEFTAEGSTVIAIDGADAPLDLRECSSDLGWPRWARARR